VGVPLWGRRLRVKPSSNVPAEFPPPAELPPDDLPPDAPPPTDLPPSEPPPTEPPPTEPPPPTDSVSPPQPQPPAFTPKRTLPTAHTWTEVQAGLAHLQPGDRLPCSGVVLPGFARIVRKLTAPAEVVFDSTCRSSPGTKTYAPSIFVDVAKLRLVAKGMVITNPKVGAGLQIGGLQDAVIDGFDIRDCATDAMRGFPTSAPITDSYIRCGVRDWALVKSLDDHAEDGTGLHGCNLENSGQATFHLDRNTVVLTTPGSKIGGALLELGSSRQAWAPTGNRLWLQAANLLQDAQTQTAGNGLNVWGYLGALDVLWLGASGLHGFALHSSPYGGTFAGPVRVKAGSAVNCCLNPRYRGQSPWMTKGGVQYPNRAAVT
jgi:hypothetical protein